MEETLFTGPLQEDGPEVTVEVGGTMLPKMTTEEEIQVECSLYPTPSAAQVTRASVLHLQMLHLAQHHLDMMESVMVRVEELMDNT